MQDNTTDFAVFVNAAIDEALAPLSTWTPPQASVQVTYKAEDSYYESSCPYSMPECGYY